MNRWFTPLTCNSFIQVLRADQQRLRATRWMKVLVNVYSTAKVSPGGEPEPISLDEAICHPFHGFCFLVLEGLNGLVSPYCFNTWGFSLVFFILLVYYFTFYLPFCLSLFSFLVYLNKCYGWGMIQQPANIDVQGNKWRQ